MASAERGAKFLEESAASKPRISTAADYSALLERLWKDGLPSGDYTGWANLDKLYKVLPGQLTIITGWPSSGKSNWLDCLLINLAKRGWRHAVFSGENYPRETHLANLLEKLAGKPFGPGPTERIGFDELREYNDSLAQWFGFIDAPREQAISIAELLGSATSYLDQFSGDTKRGLVIDPWNELEHWRPSQLSETEYISQALSMVRNWARKTNTHVWMVAHPAKSRRDDKGKLPVPRPDMISGSQNWWNKADCAVTIWRDLEDGSTSVQVYVQKVRFKHIGKIGSVELTYDRLTGRYSVPLGAASRDYQQAKDGE
jgi:twinkle protein